MTITYVIPGATELNQLDPTALDGVPPNNDNDDCVPTSIAEGLHILTGQTFDGDELKDAVYGAGYVGTMAASAYVSYCHGQGVSLTSFTSSSQADLVSEIHAQVSAGHPVVLTMPSQWGTAPADPMNPGSSHVGCAVGVGDGYIRVMNPWGGFWQDQPDSWWQARLCYGQVWPMEEIAMAGVPTGWHDDGTTLTAPAAPDGKQYTCVLGEREFVLANDWDPTDVPVSEEIGVAEVELGAPSQGAGSIQFFLKSGQNAYTQARGVYRVWDGQEMLALRNRINTLTAAQAQTQANLTAALGQRDALSSQLAAAQAQEAASQAEVTTLQQQLAAAQAQIASGPPAVPPAPSPLEAAAVQLAPALKAFLAAANSLT